MNPTLSLSKRASGVLLHPSSLPGPHGIGDLGPEAYRFVDFLAQARQSWWQMFPLGPPGYGGSPYQPLSAFAGNPLFISLDRLAKDGLLKPHDLKGFPKKAASIVDFQKVQAYKTDRFRKAYSAFAERKQGAEFRGFYEKHRDWLEDYSLYCVLKEIYGGKSWTSWDEGMRLRKPKAIRAAKKVLAGAMRFHQFLQYQFFRQWADLKAYAHTQGVGLIGDIPIFVAHDSADVWAHPHLFWLDAKGQPLYVAGTPPDYFSRDGQRWGNPLYQWNVLEREGYHWWFRRFQTLLELVDAVRLDHFIGFERYWRIPAKDTTAKGGRWIPGPSDRFFTALLKKLGRVEIIAEDLGAMTDEVKALRDRFKFPGMKILQFAFGDGSKSNPFLPHNFMRNSVVYTGTHDNDTTVGWFQDSGGKASTRSKAQIRNEKYFAKEYMQSIGKDIHWDMIRLAQMSVANTAIIPAQDLLGLGTEARMNTPGTSKGNWKWRMKPGALNQRVASRLGELTEDYGRGSR